MTQHAAEVKRSLFRGTYGCVKGVEGSFQIKPATDPDTVLVLSKHELLPDKSIKSKGIFETKVPLEDMYNVYHVSPKAIYNYVDFDIAGWEHRTQTLTIKTSEEPPEIEGLFFTLHEPGEYVAKVSYGDEKLGIDHVFTKPYYSIPFADDQFDKHKVKSHPVKQPVVTALLFSAPLVEKTQRTAGSPNTFELEITTFLKSLGLEEHTPSLGLQDMLLFSENVSLAVEMKGNQAISNPITTNPLLSISQQQLRNLILRTAAHLVGTLTKEDPTTDLYQASV